MGPVVPASTWPSDDCLSPVSQVLVALLVPRAPQVSVLLVKIHTASVVKKGMLKGKPNILKAKEGIYESFLDIQSGSPQYSQWLSLCRSYPNHGGTGVRFETF